MKNLNYLSAFLLFLSMSVSAQNNQDKETAFEINNEGIYYFKEMKGFGKTLEVVSVKDHPNQRFEETNSVWLKVTDQLKGKLNISFSSVDSRDNFTYIILKRDSFNRLTATSKCTKNNSLECLRSKNKNQSFKSAPLLSSNQINSLFEYNQLELDVEDGQEYFIIMNNKKSTKGFKLEITKSDIVVHDNYDLLLASSK